MVMNWVWIAALAVSMSAAAVTGNGAALAAAAAQGAQRGVQVAIGLCGALCLWSGVGALLERSALTGQLSRWLMPALGRIFPSCRRDAALAAALSGNVCANLLGLGNAATPLGIRAALGLKKDGCDTATDELCRLVVLNTASIQLIPATVAAVRSSLGCGSPFDILPAVWLASFCSAGAGLLAAWVMGRVNKDA